MLAAHKLWMFWRHTGELQARSPPSLVGGGTPGPPVALPSASLSHHHTPAAQRAQRAQRSAPPPLTGLAMMSSAVLLRSWLGASCTWHARAKRGTKLQIEGLESNRCLGWAQKACTPHSHLCTLQCRVRGPKRGSTPPAGAIQHPARPKLNYPQHLMPPHLHIKLPPQPTQPHTGLTHPTRWPKPPHPIPSTPPTGRR